MRCGRCAVTMLVLLAGPRRGAAAEPAPPVVAPADSGRLVQRFDFEEAALAPLTMPFNFYRSIAPELGFPRFGDMHLTDAVAHEGRFSFVFELEGGSMAARVPTAVIPVLPGADHAVRAWVRTDGLTHAAACLAAELHDERHQPIAGTRVESPHLRSTDWEQVVIDVPGNSPNAADLVIELLVLQPQQSGGVRGPQLGDVSGRVWFDDIEVRRQPRIELSTGQPGEIICGAAAPALQIVVRDPTDEALIARMVVTDVDGRNVRGEERVAQRGVWQHTLSLDGIEQGWYSASVEVRNGRGVVGQRAIQFVRIQEPALALREERFGVSLDEAGATSGLPLARALGLRSLLLPARAEGQPATDLIWRYRQAFAPPPDLALRLPAAVPPGAAVDEAAIHSALRRGGMDGVLLTFGLGGRHCVLDLPGATDAASAEYAALLPDRKLESLVGAVARALREYVADPVLLVPWPVEHEPAPIPAPHGYWLSVPASVPPASIEGYAQRFGAAERPVFATLDILDGRYAPADRVTDLVLRGLHAWRGGLRGILIAAPWSQGATTAPEPAFPAWRALAQRLDGRRFMQELPIEAGLRCWLLAGPGPQDWGLVAWRQGEDAGRDLRLELAAGPVEGFDVFGNRRTIEPREGVHTVAIGARPVFLEGIDGVLAQFRAGLRLEPPFLDARRQVHDCELVVTNPWDETISGTLGLRPPAGWRIEPRLHRISLRGGEEVRLPVSIVIAQRTVTGPAALEADVILTGNGDRRLRVLVNVEAGVQGLEFAASWRLDPPGGGSDLVIDQSITNTTDQALSLVAYVTAPDIGRLQQAIGTLPPGQTALRSFRLRGGARILPGRDVRLGVIEQSGARLNRSLEIPEEILSAAQVGSGRAAGD